MDSDHYITTKIARELLNQNDPTKRNRLMLKSIGVLLALTAMHGFFSNLESPRKLVPQTMSAIFMGYTLLYILSLRRFDYLARFIDWRKVEENAGEGAPGQPEP
jgi:hypothetical protein